MTIIGGSGIDVSGLTTDVDVSYMYNEDGTISQIIYTGYAHTKTEIYTWSGGVLQSVATVLS